MSIVSTPHGKMRIIESDKVISRSLALYGEWAADELNLLKQIIAPGACVLDVGAFIGTHTIAFSRFVGPSGKVYSFEPQREIYSILSENISINNCSNVTALNIGLGENAHEQSLAPVDINQSENFGTLSLDEYHSPNTDTYEIQISTIDSLALERIDLIKLDVEGMEKRVLDGAIKFILRYQPVIFCECNSLNAGKELLGFCQEQRYKAYGFLASAYNPNNFNGIKENIFGDAKELALLLVPEEKLEETLSKMTADRLLPINTLEDIVLPLLHKPQYAYEVLAHTATSVSLGIDFPSPLVVARDAQIASFSSRIDSLASENALLHKDILRVKSSASWQITKPLRLAQYLIRSIISGISKQ